MSLRKSVLNLFAGNRVRILCQGGQMKTNNKWDYSGFSDIQLKCYASLNHIISKEEKEYALKALSLRGVKPFVEKK